MLEVGLFVIGLLVGGAIGAAVIYYVQKPRT
jgi:hypothetical protein